MANFQIINLVLIKLSLQIIKQRLEVRVDLLWLSQCIWQH